MIFLYTNTNSRSTKYWKLFGAALCFAYFLSCTLHPETWHIIDGINLLIHEAGHWLFMPFGEFIGVLGGTLLQLIIPCLFVFYFWWQREYIDMSVMLFWVGQNLANVSNYVADAVMMQLPLLGGDGSIHDWNYLLTQTGNLKYTMPFAHALQTSGIILIVIGAGIVIWEEILKDRVIKA